MSLKSRFNATTPTKRKIIIGLVIACAVLIAVIPFVVFGKSEAEREFLRKLDAGEVMVHGYWEEVTPDGRPICYECGKPMGDVRIFADSVPNYSCWDCYN